MASDFPPPRPLWDALAHELSAAAAICARAGSPDRVDWSAFCGADRERSLLARIQSAQRQIGAQPCSPGWTPLLARLFLDVQEAFETADPDGALMGAWKWSDVKSKFNTLRAYGRLASAGEAALERSLHGLGNEGGFPAWGEILEGERLRELESRMERLQTGSAPASEGGRWSRRMGISPASFDLEARRKEALAGACAQTQLLAHAAEMVLSPALCETCSGPARDPMHRASYSCPHCEGLLRLPNGDPSSLPPIALPKPALALAALAQLCASLRRNASRQTRGAANPPPIPSFEELAADLAPLAQLALEGFDVNMDLGRGVRLAHYRWPEEALLWLDQAGCDWRATDDFDATPANRLAQESPAAWALIERRAIEPAAHPPSASSRKAL